MIRTCTCCGLAQHVPEPKPGMQAICARCETPVRRRSRVSRSASRTAAVSLAALILFPFAILLPIMRVERFGQAHDASILHGSIDLLGAGEWFVGGVVLLCSVVFPLVKLTALLILSLGGLGMQHRHRALTYRIVEWTGRWGMLDVLLVAMLVALLKIGDLVEVAPGPAAAAFTICVALSLVAAACFDPHSFWDRGEEQPT